MKSTVFSERKQLITRYLLRFLKEREQTTAAALFGTDVIRRLTSFLQEGKMIRGSLLLLTNEMFVGEYSEDALIAAAALEILHTSLLIHDDIMDNDRTRRGRETLFAQYETLATKEQLSDPSQFGRNMGICVGDIGFFLAFELLTRLSCNPDIKTQILALFAKEMTMVGLMQMQDVYYGNSSQAATLSDVMSVYTYKTARYTFSLPLTAGALLAEQDAQILQRLEKLGESLGIIFQIKDDELGLFGTEEQIGKPVGSDIRENKKTIFYLYLFTNATVVQQKKLKSIFGNPSLTQEMITYVQNLTYATGTKAAVDKILVELGELAQTEIAALPVTEQNKAILSSLVVDNTKRKA